MRLPLIDEYVLSLNFFDTFVYIYTMKMLDGARARARRLFMVMGLFALCGALPGRGYAAELLFVDRASCPYCRAWKIEVGSVYGKTLESRIAPLRRVEIDEIGRVPYAFKEPVLYTPTFVLIDRNLEIGRIVGYSDEAAFWGQLHELLQRLEPDRPAPARIKRETGYRFQ